MVKKYGKGEDTRLEVQPTEVVTMLDDGVSVNDQTSSNSNVITPIIEDSAINAEPSLFRVLKTNTIPKVSIYSIGTITYQLLQHNEDGSLHIMVIDNSESGQFSKEKVSFDSIEQIIKPVRGGEFPAKVLKSAFVSKSTNNSGFLMAILIAEGLMMRVGDKSFAYQVINDWTAWRLLQGHGSAVQPIKEVQDS